MIDRDKIRIAVYRAIEEANQLSADGEAAEVTESTILLGPEAALNSMGFVNFVVALEEEVNRLTDRPLDLFEKINSAEGKGYPISTVGQLMDLLSRTIRS